MNFVAINVKILFMIDNYVSDNMRYFLEQNTQSLSQANCIIVKVVISFTFSSRVQYTLSQ